jgi:hypothetical protein
MLPEGHAQATRCIDNWDAARLKKVLIAQVNMNRAVTEKQQHTILRYIWCCLRFRCVSCCLVVLPRRIDASITGMQPDFKRYGVAQVNMNRVVTEK